MEQLIMRWTNDGTPAETVTLPEDVALVRFPDLPNALGEWLAIVENVVRAHHGIVHAENAPGGGFSVSMEIPLDPGNR